MRQKVYDISGVRLIKEIDLKSSFNNYPVHSNYFRNFTHTKQGAEYLVLGEFITSRTMPTKQFTNLFFIYNRLLACC